MLESGLAICAVLSLSATAISVIACLWQIKLRQSVARVLTESTNQQVRTAQRLFETLAQLQKSQQNYEKQLCALSQANAQLRQSLGNMSARQEHAPDDAPRQRPTIH
ncbi:MAG: hypothetical protein ABTQ34_00175 [Bdellovibrionales bacterium]